MIIVHRASFNVLIRQQNFKSLSSANGQQEHKYMVNQCSKAIVNRIVCRESAKSIFNLAPFIFFYEGISCRVLLSVDKYICLIFVVNIKNRCLALLFIIRKYSYRFLRTRQVYTNSNIA